MAQTYPGKMPERPLPRLQPTGAALSARLFAAHGAQMFGETQTELLPPKRIGTPEKVAHTALSLASDEARFINATDSLIDGDRSQLYHE